MKLGDTQVTTDLRDSSKQQLFPRCYMSACPGCKRGSSSPDNAEAEAAGRPEVTSASTQNIPSNKGEAVQRAFLPDVSVVPQFLHRFTQITSHHLEYI